MQENPSAPLPSIKVIPLTPPQSRSKLHPSPLTPRKSPSAAFADIRWSKVQEFLETRNLDTNTKQAYQRELKRWLAWSELGWGEVRSRHLAHYKQYLTNLPTQRGHPRTKSSINAAITALRSCFRWLSEVYPDQVSANPAAHLELEKLPLPPAQSLTPEQMDKIWAAIATLGGTRLRDNALIHVLRYAGLREEEAANLNVGSLLEGRTLFIADTKTNEPREVPLPKVAIAALFAYLDWRRASGEDLTPDSSDSPMFLSQHPGYQGKRLTPGGIYLAVRRLGDLAGIDGLHPHLFRHTYATHLLRDRLDPNHAMMLTGHRDVKAFTRYTRGAKMEAAIAAYYRAIREDGNDRN